MHRCFPLPSLGLPNLFRSPSSDAAAARGVVAHHLAIVLLEVVLVVVVLVRLAVAVRAQRRFAARHAHAHVGCGRVRKVLLRRPRGLAEAAHVIVTSTGSILRRGKGGHGVDELLEDLGLHELTSELPRGVTG